MRIRRNSKNKTMAGKNIALAVVFSLCLPYTYTVSAQPPVTSPVLNVSFPTSLDFYIDSHDLTGNGTLFSPAYEIVNYSSLDVIISVDSLYYTLPEDSQIETCSVPPDKDDENSERAVFMMFRPVSPAELDEDEDKLIGGEPDWLMSRRDNDYIISEASEDTAIKIYLEAADYDEDGNFISLNEQSTFRFALVGDVRSDSSDEWQSGDISFKIVYSWDIAEPEASEVLTEEMTTFEAASPAPSDDNLATASPLPPQKPVNSPLPSSHPVISPLPSSQPVTVPPAPSASPDHATATASPLPSAVPGDTEAPVPSETPAPAIPSPSETPVPDAAPLPT